MFLLGDVDLLNRTANVTHSTAHSAHQGAVKNLAKAEFVLGVALLMTQALGNGHLPNVEERIGELMLITQLTRACMRAAEADAQLDEWGVMCPEPLMVESPRNLFMTAYPKMVEIVQLLGSSSFMLTPTEADFRGPLADHIEQYLATDNTAATDRVKLFRLAWDIAGTSFGSRQVLYERFFASDPLTRARAIASIYPKKEVMDRVLDFLGRDDDALGRMTEDDRITRALLKQQIEDFLYREADLLDERHYDEWLALLAEDVRYWMPMRRNVKLDDREREFTREGRDISWFDEGKETLTRRVRQIQTGIHWAEEPVSRISHLLSNIQLVEVNPSAADPAEVSVRCRFLVYRNRVETETDILVGNARICCAAPGTAGRLPAARSCSTRTCC